MREIDVIVTLGPQSWSDDALSALVAEGVRTFRFPFSKETPEHHARVHDRLRQVASRAGIEVKAWADLPGGKPRLDNTTAREIFASRTYRVAFRSASTGADFRIDPALLREPVSSTYVVGDGPLVFVVDKVLNGVAIGRFDRDGILQPTRGFIPVGDASFTVVTERDRRLARVACEAGMDGVALSFVALAGDILDAKAWLASELGWWPALIAKIETPAGVAGARGVADVADHVMLARGDLALTAGIENLWWSQKKVIDACVAGRRPVIVATGLLESSENQLTVTRSNAIDIGTALDMGASALLLSAETTIGADPVGAVVALRRHISAWGRESESQT